MSTRTDIYHSQLDFIMFTLMSETPLKRYYKPGKEVDGNSDDITSRSFLVWRIEKNWESSSKKKETRIKECWNCFSMQKIVFPNMHTANRCFKKKAGVSEATIHLYSYCRWKTEFCVVLQIWYTNSFKCKDLKERSSPNFVSSKVKAGACCLVSWHSVSVGQNSSSNPTTRWVRDTLECEPGKKEEVLTPDVDLLSETRVHTLIRGV